MRPTAFNFSGSMRNSSTSYRRRGTALPRPDERAAHRLVAHLDRLKQTALHVNVRFLHLGGRQVAGAAVSPDISNSLVPYGYSADVTFILAANSSLTMFTTNSWSRGCSPACLYEAPGRGGEAQHRRIRAGHGEKTERRPDSARPPAKSSRRMRSAAAPPSPTAVYICSVSRLRRVDNHLAVQLAQCPCTRRVRPCSHMQRSNRPALPRIVRSSFSASDSPRLRMRARDESRAEAVSSMPV